MENQDYPPTTKELPAPPSISQKSTPATEREVTIVLETLAIHFPRTDMDSRKWKILFATFYEDLKHKTLTELQFGSHRYRTNHENRFFPTPGQLLEACKNPYADARPRRYAALEPLPEEAPADRVRELIEKTRAKFGYYPDKSKVEAYKAEIRARPPKVMTVAETILEKELAAEREATLKGRLAWKHG